MDNQDFHQNFFDLSDPKYVWDEKESERDLEFINLTSKQLNIPSASFNPIELPESLLGEP